MIRKNQFYDVNKMPQQEGLIIFGISMNRIGNVQSAKKCFDYMNNFIPKIFYPVVGLIFIYADSLYLYSDEKASILKKRFQNLIHSHKNEFIKILRKHPSRIPKAFSYLSWNQLILETKEFFNYFGKLQKIYKEDKKFQEYVNQDIGKSKPAPNEIDFILEEILIFYLIAKGKVRLYNDYVQDKQKWILQCYPGKPLLSEIYLFQENFFRLSNPSNVYENSFYDLKDKKLYDYKKINLSNFVI
ncbi:hypothetical protein HYW74_05050 [Candidatus Pacearchaeota archaeon]|nr:hypothetical protein [Candidatus Pacearchaeota archaeon]